MAKPKKAPTEKPIKPLTKRTIRDSYESDKKGVKRVPDDQFKKITIGRGNRKYKTAQEMFEKCKEYFEGCKPVPMLDKSGKPMYDQRGNAIYDYNPVTITGLALFLGFYDRSSFYDAADIDDDYAAVIKWAKTMCENTVERGALSGKIAAGTVAFILKQYGWKDETEIKAELVGGINIIIDNQDNNL